MKTMISNKENGVRICSILIHLDINDSPKIILEDKVYRRTSDQVNNIRVAVICKHCGGTNNIVLGESSKCEYCGAIINTKENVYI